MIRLTIIAAHLPVRIGLREILSGRDGIEVTSEANSLDSASRHLAGTDILVFAAPFDPAMSMDDLDELMDGNDPGNPLAVLFLSDELPEFIRSARSLRVWGILPLSAGEDELEAAIRALAEGLVVGSPNLLEEAWRRPVVTPLRLLSSSEQMTPRESEVLALMARGLANKQIAAQLGISEHTVKFHLSSIYAKLGAGSRTEALTIGTRLGLIVL